MTPHGGRAVTRLKRRRVLVIDDTREIRDVFRLLLEAEGAEVVTAATGGEAIRLAQQQSFDVVLSDLGLPDIAGDVVIREILVSGRGVGRVVIVTGRGDVDVTRLHALGAAAVFIKPLDWTRLVDFVAGDAEPSLSRPPRRSA